MSEKRFKVHTEEYQDTDDMGYAIAPPVIYYYVGNSEIGFNFDTEREAKMLCEAWNKLVEENEQSKMMIATLRNILEQEDLEKENKDLEEARSYYQENFLTMKTERHQLKEENKQLKQFKDNVFDLIDKNIKETKELFEDGKIDLISYNGAMIILIGLKEELGGDVE